MVNLFEKFDVVCIISKSFLGTTNFSQMLVINSKFTTVFTEVLQPGFEDLDIVIKKSI